MPRWTPEVAFDEAFARRLIEAQFPHLQGVSMRRIGAGWDNAAYLVEEHIVFRFPQRAVAGPLIARENALLPLIATALPVAIPVPRYIGTPQDEYPWAFSGYEILAGVSACTRIPDDGERRALAGDLGRFLRALHSIDPQPLRDAGLPHDLIGRLDPARLKVDEEPLDAPHCVVHGDLYARHVLLDTNHRISAVIDWGDLHYGHAAVDLMSVYQMVPQHHHDAFFAEYGEVDERTLRFARYRAAHHVRMILEYCASVDDPALLAGAQLAASYLSP